MSVGRPDLLSIDDEAVAIFDGARLQRSDVGAGVRFRVPLAPDFLRRQYLRDVALLLFLGTQPDQRRPDQHNSENVHEHRRVDPGHFLAVDELLRDGCVAPAVFFGPAQADPSAFIKLPVPLQTPLPTARTFVQHAELVVYGTAATAGFGQVDCEPASKLLAEGFVLGAEIKIHQSQCLIRFGSLESCCALTSYCSRQDSRAGEFRLALLDES